MADTKKFRVEYGVSVGTTDVIDNNGKVVSNAVSNFDTDNLSEGSSNLYFTNSRFDTRLDSSTIDGGTF